MNNELVNSIKAVNKTAENKTVKEVTMNSNGKLIMFSDGSKNKETGSICYGLCGYIDNVMVVRKNGVILNPDDDQLKGQQVPGELQACIEAVKIAHDYNISATLFVDYDGILHWLNVNGYSQWKANKTYTRSFITWMKENNKLVDIQWIKGHANITGNEEADRLATLASHGQIIEEINITKEVVVNTPTQHSFPYKAVIAFTSEMRQTISPYITQTGNVLPMAEGWTAFDELGIRTAKMSHVKDLPADMIPIGPHVCVVEDDFELVKNIFGKNAANCGAYSTKFANAFLHKVTFKANISHRIGIDDGNAWHNREMITELGGDRSAVYNFIAIASGKTGIAKGASIPSNKVTTMTFHDSCLKGLDIKDGDEVTVFFYKEHEELDYSMGRQVLQYMTDNKLFRETADKALDEIEAKCGNIEDILTLRDGDDNIIYDYKIATLKKTESLQHFAAHNRAAKDAVLKYASKLAMGNVKMSALPIIAIRGLKKGQVGLYYGDEKHPETLTCLRYPVLSPAGIRRMKVVNLSTLLHDEMLDNLYIEGIAISKEDEHNFQHDYDGDALAFGNELDGIGRLAYPFDSEQSWVKTYKRRSLEYSYDQLTERLVYATHVKHEIPALICSYEYYVAKRDYSNAAMFATLAHNHIDGIKKEVVVGSGEGEMPVEVFNVLRDPECRAWPLIFSMKKGFTSTEAFYNAKRRERIKPMFESILPVDSLACHVYNRVDKILADMPAEYPNSSFVNLYGNGDRMTANEMREFAAIERRYRDACVSTEENHIRRSLLSAVHAEIDSFAKRIGSKKVIGLWQSKCSRRVLRDGSEVETNGRNVIPARMIAAVFAEALNYKVSAKLVFNIARNPEAEDPRIGMIAEIIGNKFVCGGTQYHIYADQMTKLTGFHNIRIREIGDTYKLDKAARESTIVKSIRIIAEPVTDRNFDDTIRVRVTEDDEQITCNVVFNEKVETFMFGGITIDEAKAYAILHFLKNKQYDHPIRLEYSSESVVDIIRTNISDYRVGHYPIIPVLRMEQK